MRKTFMAGLLLAAFAAISVLPGCRATVRELKPGEKVLYGAEYGYTDLQVLSKDMANRILESRVGSVENPPVMLITGIENRTDEHIDTKALAYAIRNHLIKSGKFRFINEAQRKKLIKEMEYQEQGYISPETRIRMGKQVGADYILSGQLVSISAEQARQVRVKKKNLRYYRLTLEITGIDTNLIVWADEQEIVREEAKPFIGW